MQKAKERIYLTADRKQLVGEGDKRAAFLYAAIGDEIPASAAEAYGLVDGRLKGSKGKPANEDKERKGAGNKGGGNKGGSPDDLTKVKGIGEATAKALTDAGIATFAQLAAIDPAAPPVMVPGVGRPDWAGWAEAAKEFIPAAPQE